MRWMVACLMAGLWMAELLTDSMVGQSVQTGRSAETGALLLQGQESGGSGGPATYAARTDLAVFGSGATGELLPAGCASQSGAAYTECLANAYNSSATTGHQGAALSYTGGPTVAPPAAGTTVSGTNINGLNSYLSGVNTQIVDPDFGTMMIRATDASQNGSVACLGGQGFGTQFNVGSSGDGHGWAADESKLIILNTGGINEILAFNPSSGLVTPSDICGGYLPGAATFSGTNAHILYSMNNDQESTVPFSSTTGTLLTAETVTNGSASAMLQAINPSSNFAQFGIVTGTASGSVWTGQTSGATLTAVSNPGVGAANTPYANTIYKGVICDGSSDLSQSVCGARNPWYGTSNPCAGAGNSTNPACWYVQWSLLFDLNYHGSPLYSDSTHFPLAANNCLPQNYNADYTGLFMGSDDDSTFGVILSDNGQANHTGNSGSGYTCSGAMGPGAVGTSGSHTCTGPVYVASYKQGSGCRIFNSMTDQISGDWGTNGQALNGQAYEIPVSGSISGTLTPGDALKQLGTGAEAQITCAEDSTTACNTSNVTQVEVGLIYTNGVAANGTGVWQDCGTNGTACSSSNEFTPAGAPVPATFYYPDVLHDASQQSNAAVQKVTVVQQPNMKVTQIAYNASTHQTTITYNNSASYSWAQQFNFANLLGTDDQYLNCGTLVCPILTAIAGGQSGTITVTDTLGGPSNYTDTESQSGCGTECPMMYPNSQGGRNGFVGVNYWITSGLVLHPALAASGHASLGYNYDYQGKYYTAFNIQNPSTPATVDGTPSGATYGIAQSAADYQTPPPNGNLIQLLPASVVDDQHGSNNAHGTDDYSPPSLITTLVCAQGGEAGVGSFDCETSFASVWDAEILAVENWVSRSSPGNLVGADCNYGAGSTPCVYRLGHTFNTGDNWNFNGQNAIGRMSPDGNWLVFPSDWNKTLGCLDGASTNCWSSWEATAPAASGTNVSWTSDGASPPNVTIAMTNSFCPTGGTQYYWVNGAVQSFTCGTRAGTVRLTGFAESWLNDQTLTLGANTSNNWQCDSSDASAGTCNQFVLAGVTGAPANSSGTESGTEKATPTACGNGVPCQREDLWIAKISSAHQ